MSQFIVQGGKPLNGVIYPQGAKNEALQVISAVLLTAEPVTIANIPDILDVNLQIELLRSMGVKVTKTATDTAVFDASAVDLDYLESDAFHKKSGQLRGSVMLAGPLLGRFGKAFMPKPGGDKIGRRRLDTHLLGFQQMGAKLSYHDDFGYYRLTGSQMQGNYLLLDEPSVTGTANLVMAAALTPGTTTLYHAACEPYLQQLCAMINRMGGQISGIGSNLLTIQGVEKLQGTTHRILPD
ncbi:MAG: UDP-N-acetylglucosamine 1-carboxyvinyltransferase, partial [Chitinophagaceae bacterium]|nr:UDP-N-acetylglucosamine 1-carboxyvinyltransferase [Chitinophagaceae bacterium]